MKVLLVDDDVEMLESMRRMTLALGGDWQVIGLAEDGTDALRLLKAQSADILVTDITMYEMDGLELIQQARQLCPELRSLLITCHEDFQYAQEGIKLGVEDYLVKYTLTEAKFHQALLQARQKIEKAQGQKSSLEHLSTEVYKNREHFRENLIRTLLTAPKVDMEPILTHAPLYGIALPESTFTVTAIQPLALAGGRISYSDERLIGYAVMNIAQELIDFVPSFAFRLDGYVYLLLWNTADVPSWRTRLADRLNQLREHILEKFNTGLCVVAGVQRTSLAGLRQTITGLTAFWEGCFYGSPVLLEEDAAQRGRFSPEPVPPTLLCELQTVLFDLPRLQTIFDGACDQIGKARYSPAEVRAFFDEFATQLQLLANYSGCRLPLEPVTGLTFAACRSQVEAMLKILSETCFWQPGKRPSSDVQQVAEHVNAHLDTELSLEAVAALVHKNSSYLSRQFKKETGLSFSEFVIRQRIRRATYLLQNTDHSVESIAVQVGIASGPYFSTFYKRETGLSPGEARRQSGEKALRERTY